MNSANISADSSPGAIITYFDLHERAVIKTS